MEYKKFRVKSAVKSFRDLEVYRKTTELAVQIFEIEIPSKIKSRKILLTEVGTLREIVKQIPRFIAEAYGDRFSDKKLGIAKMEKAMQLTAVAIVKMDFLITLAKDQALKNEFLKIISKYQIQKRKILNLRRVWDGSFVRRKH